MNSIFFPHAFQSLIITIKKKKVQILGENLNSNHTILAVQAYILPFRRLKTLSNAELLLKDVILRTRFVLSEGWNKGNPFAQRKQKALSIGNGIIRTNSYLCPFVSYYNRTDNRVVIKENQLFCSIRPKSMGCCGGRSLSRPKGMREETLVRVPGALVHLMDKSDVVGLAKGDLTIVQVTDGTTNLATVVRVGHDLGWPLTKDEPVVKLDRLHYLFTIPNKEGGFLNYGVSFASADARLASLDMFLKEHACFSTPNTNAPTSGKEKEKSSYEVYWKDYAPKIEGYNGVLGKAIAAGTGQIVRGIFMLSNTYTSQAQKGANMIQAQGSGNNTTGGSFDGRGKINPNYEANRKNSEINKSIKRVRKLTEMTEKMSASLLDVVVSATGSITAPLFQSKAGKSFLSMVPGEVLLASLDAINKVMDAVEVAERRSLAATSNVVAGAVSKRFGESAGEATEDVFATAGHAVGTAWNLFKIRKAVTPSSSMPSAMLKNAVRNKTG